MDIEVYGGEERILEKGFYRGFAYVIKSLGSHPTAYVSIDIPLWFFDSSGWEKELTYNSHSDPKIMGLDYSSHWIGWDYAHFGDYYQGKSIETTSPGHHYTMKEIRIDVMRIIDNYIDSKKYGRVGKPTCSC